MGEKQADIARRLADSILEDYDPEMIILFGSTARGDFDEFSDIDILVIIDVENPEVVSEKIVTDTDHIHNEKDIKVITTDEFYFQKDIPGTILFPIVNEGIVLYKKPDFKTDIEPSLKYEDRKTEIINKEFIEQAFDFLEQAESAFQKNNIYRCRDYLRFAVIRALKAVFALRDIHPPRETDLDLLRIMTNELHPVVKELTPLIIRVKDFNPAGNIESSSDPREVIDDAVDIVNRVKKVMI